MIKMLVSLDKLVPLESQDAIFFLFKFSYWAVLMSQITSLTVLVYFYYTPIFKMKTFLLYFGPNSKLT